MLFKRFIATRNDPKMCICTDLDEWRPNHRPTGSDHGWTTDWRHEGSIVTPQCQGILANAMREEAKALEHTDRPVRFVVNAGDNFYPAGVNGVGDPVWEVEWGRVYRGLPPLPWYSVYGNHDYVSCTATTQSSEP